MDDEVRLLALETGGDEGRAGAHGEVMWLVGLSSVGRTSISALTVDEVS